ncbi:MAG: hypothetical protein ACLFM7_06325, partial [Bacteroidales bacterium]
CIDTALYGYFSRDENQSCYRKTVARKLGIRPGHVREISFPFGKIPELVEKFPSFVKKGTYPVKSGGYLVCEASCLVGKGGALVIEGGCLVSTGSCLTSETH